MNNPITPHPDANLDDEYSSPQQIDAIQAAEELKSAVSEKAEEIRRVVALLDRGQSHAARGVDAGRSDRSASQEDIP